MACKNQLNKSSATATSFIDFEPQTELKKQDSVDTLVISLPGFSKEHLKVQVNNVGRLKVSGEKPENIQGITTKRCFIKETTVSEHCDLNGIRAKFINGELHVIMPKNPVVEGKEKEHEHEHEKEQAKLSPSMTKPKDDVPPPPMPKTETSEKKQMESSSAGVNRRMDGLGGDLLMRLQRKNNNKVAIGFGVAVMAMVAFGAFLAHKYGSSSSTSSYMEEL